MAMGTGVMALGCSRMFARHGEGCPANCGYFPASPCPRDPGRWDPCAGGGYAKPPPTCGLWVLFGIDRRPSPSRRSPPKRLGVTVLHGGTRSAAYVAVPPCACSEPARHKIGSPVCRGAGICVGLRVVPHPPFAATAVRCARARLQHAQHSSCRRSACSSWHGAPRESAPLYLPVPCRHQRLKCKRDRR